jgi:primosomal protein N' (replication factor Y)
MYPPYVHFIKITMRSRIEANAEKSAEKLAETLKAKIKDVDIVGVAPSPMTKLRGYYRWNVIIRTKDRMGMVASLRTALHGFRKGSGVFMAVDVDPMTM